jgi:hypothetical protein
VAEVCQSVLTDRTRIRIVDFHAEAKDPDAGRWIYADDLRGTPAPAGWDRVEA